MEKFRLVKYCVRVHLRKAEKDDGMAVSYVLLEPHSGAPWEFATHADAARVAADTAASFENAWCEVFEVEKRIRPLRGHVVLRVLSKPDRHGSIFFTAQGREDTAEVLACGRDVVGVRVGEVVCFDPYAVRLAVNHDGMDCTNSVYATAGSLAVVREDAIRYVLS